MGRALVKGSGHVDGAMGRTIRLPATRMVSDARGAKASIIVNGVVQRCVLLLLVLCQQVLWQLRGKDWEVKPFSIPMATGMKEQFWLGQCRLVSIQGETSLKIKHSLLDSFLRRKWPKVKILVNLHEGL